jgi:hypothetical protein
MINKIVDIEISALGVTSVKAVVTEYRESEGVVVYDLYDSADDLVAKSRYSLIADAPFEFTEADIA